MDRNVVNKHLINELKTKFQNNNDEDDDYETITNSSSQIVPSAVNRQIIVTRLNDPRFDEIERGFSSGTDDDEHQTKIQTKIKSSSVVHNTEPIYDIPVYNKSLSSGGCTSNARNESTSEEEAGSSSSGCQLSYQNLLIGSEDKSNSRATLCRSKTEITKPRSGIAAHKFFSTYDRPEIPKRPTILPQKPNSKIKHIIAELIDTEKKFIDVLRVGIKRYNPIFDKNQQHELPISLYGKKYVLLQNIDDILQFHETEFLPILINNSQNLEKMCKQINLCFENNKFYDHILYNMNFPRVTLLLNSCRNFFEMKANNCNDKLGIRSFLTQPITRLTKYPTIFNDMMKENLNNKNIAAACCRTEKTIRNFLIILNKSVQINDIQECYNINVYHQGRFKAINTFEIYDRQLRRSYIANVFLFEQSIIYAEIMDKDGRKCIYRGHYPMKTLGILPKEKHFTLYVNKRRNLECDFRPETPVIYNIWLQMLQDAYKNHALNRKSKEIFNISHLLSTVDDDNTIKYRKTRRSTVADICPACRRPFD